MSEGHFQITTNHSSGPERQSPQSPLFEQFDLVRMCSPLVNEVPVVSVVPVVQESFEQKMHDQRLLRYQRRHSLYFEETKKVRPKEKGLRKLSQRAFDIVQSMRSASYKEVANKLVSQLQYEHQLKEEKDEQNIKRRVYDALNVLIAVGVLRKQGRRIIGDSKRDSFIQTHHQLIEIRKKNTIRKNMLDQLKRHKNILQWIQNRNLRQKQILSKCKPNQIIQLPFTIVNLTRKQTDQKHNFNQYLNFLQNLQNIQTK